MVSIQYYLFIFAEMKIFKSVQLRELDHYTMEHEPIRGIDLMERAARAIVRVISEDWPVKKPVVVFAGPGNNGGDALAVARMLAEQNYQVSVYLFNIHDNLSDECAINRQRLQEVRQLRQFVEVKLNFEPPVLDRQTLVVDGLFGRGLNKPLAGGFASLVRYINQSESRVVSIDLPSGLMCENNTYNIHQNIVRADLTLTLQQEKLCMFFPENQAYLGRVKVLDIRLSQDYIDRTESQFHLIEEAEVRRMMLRRDDFAHKGNMGMALLVAGSYGMCGAAQLAAKACLRSGVGKLCVRTPKCNYHVLQSTVPEAVLLLDHEETIISEAVASEGFDALGIGPGLGRNENTAIAMIAQIRRSQCPIVLDADGINVLSTHRAWTHQLPKDIIMTPHPGEFDRLVGSPSNSSYERLTRAIELAGQLSCYILLKGHYSALCMPNGRVVFNSTGNSGMATAGSGDVLTGIITALLARGYKHAEACIVGMYLHGLAGDLAARELGKESLLASDIVCYLPKAFLKLED